MKGFVVIFDDWDWCLKFIEIYIYLQSITVPIQSVFFSFAHELQR